MAKSFKVIMTLLWLLWHFHDTYGLESRLCTMILDYFCGIFLNKY